MSTDIPIKCARRACGNPGTQTHRDLPGLYCMSCAKRINAACGIEVVSLDQSRSSNKETDMEANATDTIKAAPTAILCVRVEPNDLSVLEVKSGDDLEELIRGALGGEPESMGEPGPSEVQIGVTGVYKRGNTSLHVHTHPDAYKGLKYEIEGLQREREIAQLLSNLGINATVLRLGCICGQCGVDGPAEDKTEVDAVALD